MWDWWSSRPQYCLKFGTDSLAWAESERGWYGRRRRRCFTSSLPNGMINPSPMDPNLSNLMDLADRVQSLANSDRRTHKAAWTTSLAFPRRVTVLLPDTAVRTAVYHFDQLPPRLEERASLIRWRVGQEQLFPVNGAKIISQVFYDQEAGASRAYTVLTVSIQESVLQQYELLCESVGLIPYDVGVTSLRLLNLWRRVSGRSVRSHGHVLWINLSDRALTTIVCRRGRPIFYRCKFMGEDAAEVMNQPHMLVRVVEECRASLDLWAQWHPSMSVDQAVICVQGDVSSLKEQIEGELQLSVEQLDWKLVDALGWVAKGSHRGVPSLAALAGLP